MCYFPEFIAGMNLVGLHCFVVSENVRRWNTAMPAATARTRPTARRQFILQSYTRLPVYVRLLFVYDVGLEICSDFSLWR
jgi:hypothetical protein